MMGFSRRGSTEAAGTSLEVALDIQASADQPPGIMERPLLQGEPALAQAAPVPCFFLNARPLPPCLVSKVLWVMTCLFPWLMEWTVTYDSQHELSTHPLEPSPPCSDKGLSSHWEPSGCLVSRTNLSSSYLEHPSPHGLPQTPSSWHLANYCEHQLRRQGGSLISTGTPT